LTRRAKRLPFGSQRSGGNRIDGTRQHTAQARAG
jgi:hypothetical protein